MSDVEPEEGDTEIWEPQKGLEMAVKPILSQSFTDDDAIGISYKTNQPPRSLGLAASGITVESPQTLNSAALDFESFTVSTSRTQSGKTRTLVLGHSMIRKNFAKPAVCHHCADFVWGLFATTAWSCELCNFVVHDKCLRNMVSPCSTVLPFLIPEPVPHSWSEAGMYKRKFCSVCRKRVDEEPTYSCEVCECYVHVECSDFVASNCKQCSLSVPEEDLPLKPPQQYHHWREGNLPLNSRCQFCRKSCWSSECLTGMQCSWCYVTAHAGCQQSLPKECTYGVLRDIILPPAAVSLPRTSAIMEHIIGLQKPAYVDQMPAIRAVQDDPSSSDSKEESNCLVEKRPFRDKVEKEHEDAAKVYDGFNRFRRRQYRSVAVDKSLSVLAVVELALKAYMLPIEVARDYILVELSEKDNVSENLLKEDGGPFRRQLKFDLKRPHILIFHKSRNSQQEHMNVLPGVLIRQYNVSGSSRQVAVDRKTTVSDALKLAFTRFGVPDTNVEEYELVQVCTDAGVREYELSPQDLVWPVINQLKEDSVRVWRLTTFHVRLLRHGRAGAANLDNNKVVPSSRVETVSSMTASLPTSAELFVGNLKKGLSQKLYERILLNILGQECKWNSIESIYYDFGSLVLRYACAEKADKAYNILKGSTFEEKQILVLILPHIVPQMVPANMQPLLVFVNVRSGGCQGIDLIASFRRLLNPHQVFSLDYGGPLPGLHCFRQLPKFKILVCGGDGTVGWTLSCLDNVGQDSLCSCPPIAIVPLGTGNDLARVLRWGTGYTGTEDPLTLLRDVSEAEEIRLDRWTVVIKPNQTEQDEQKRALQLQTNIANTNEDTRRIFVMNNYFGIGIDADLNLDFHMAREENPAKFNSRIHNKGVYFKMGLRKMMYRSRCKDLQDKITLEVDGRLIDLPPLEGIIILNILSWAAGANPWGSSSSSSYTGTSYYSQANASYSGNSHDGSGNSNKNSNNAHMSGSGEQGSGGGGGGNTPGSIPQQQHFTKPTHYDGMLEVVGVTGVVHMGQIVSGLRTGSRIAQGGHIRICLKQEMPVQVDGEPWVQAPGLIIVLRSALRATMLKKRKRQRVNRRNTEPSISGGVPSTSVPEEEDTTISVDTFMDSPEIVVTAGESSAPPPSGKLGTSPMLGGESSSAAAHHYPASPS